MTALQPPASASSESRKPNRIGRSGATASRLWPCQGLALPEADQVGERRRDVEQGDDLVVRARPAAADAAPTIRNGVQVDSR